MRTGFQISSLVPIGLVFDGVSDSMDSLILAVRSEAAEARCPLCATASSRIHSRYVRHVADLPSAGRKVRLRLLTRRFTCEAPHCRRRIFAERFGEDAEFCLSQQVPTHVIRRLTLIIKSRKCARRPRVSTPRWARPYWPSISAGASHSPVRIAASVNLGPYWPRCP